MKNKIEFRGVRVDGKGWVYGYYYYCNWFEKGYRNRIRVQKDNHFIDIAVIEETVGQYSQRENNKGNKIFVGDNVYLAGYGVYEVEFPFTELYSVDNYKEDIGTIRSTIHDHLLKGK